MKYNLVISFLNIDLSSFSNFLFGWPVNCFELIKRIKSNWKKILSKKAKIHGEGWDVSFI